MKNAWKLVIFAVILSLLTQVMKRVMDGYGIPNVASPGRDMLLFCVFAYLLFASGLLRDKLFVAGSTILSVVLISYIFIAAFTGKLFAGLYYLRVYLMPIILLYCMIAFIDRLDKTQLRRSWAVFLSVNFFILAAASATYIVAMVVPSFKNTLMGSSRLETLGDAWYIAGANVLRMGLPFASPNSLGTYLALTMLVILAKVAMDFKREGSSSSIYYVLLGLNFSALAMTFSRSAAVVFLLGALITMFNPKTSNAKVMRIGTLAILFCIGLSIPIFILVDILNDGVLHKWFALNTNLSDPSMQGHYFSIFEAIHAIDEYFLLGFPKGTVGPKAMMFSVDIRNVENSTFSIFYDMGLIFGIAFIIGYGILIKRLFMSAFQLAILLTFLIAMQVLPYIYEYEIIIYFIFCYAMIGFVSKLPTVEPYKKEVLA